MRHLFFCREFPPASGGGIGSYTARIATLLAEHGETVHVVAQRWKGAGRPEERRLDGRLVIHRVPCERSGLSVGLRSHPAMRDPTALALFRSSYHPQAFAWSAGLLAEELVEKGLVDVIEAPEYEAPLYFFQLRRALGLGPSRRPPCLVHLHSPTEIIVRSNDWDVGHPYFLTAKRLEDFSISGADALVCPSHYLADEISARRDLRCTEIRVVHYPAPEWEPIDGNAAPNVEGPIVHVGRLEGRKGSLEWLDAAVAAARGRPDVRFEFVGQAVLNTDWRTGDEVVAERIPPTLRKQFVFHGQKRPSEVREILGRARFAVVPSRWDNFPNTCIEAMSMGLPMLATRNGGMVQLIDDGETGWLAASPGAADLYAALIRALNTPAPTLTRMGRAAAEAVRERCAPERIVEEHLALKAELARVGPRRSLSLPPVLRPHAPDPGRVGGGPPGSGEGVGVVVVCPSHASPTACLEALSRQSVPAVATVLVQYDPAEGERYGHVKDGSVEVLPFAQPDRASATQSGLAALLSRDPPPTGVAVLDHEDRPLPGFVERCGAVLATCPEVGLVSFWESPVDGAVIGPCPARPYQWAWNDAAPASVVRVDALQRIDGLPVAEDPLYERWYLANAAFASGWAGVTIPEILAERSRSSTAVGRLDSTRMIRAMQAPFGSEISEDAPTLLPLLRSGSAGALRKRHFRPREYSELAKSLAGDWRRALRWGWSRLVDRLRRG